MQAPHRKLCDSTLVTCEISPVLRCRDLLELVRAALQVPTQSLPQAGEGTANSCDDGWPPPLNGTVLSREHPQ